MSRLRGVLIGTGAVAGDHAAAFARERERIALVAVMDRNRERAEAFCARHGVARAYSDYQAVLDAERPDVVVICTPPAVHHDQCVQAMEAGAWVLCEKPLCASLAQMDSLLAVEARTGCYTSVIAQRRFGSGGLHLKRLIDANAFGAPLLAICQTTWFRDADYYRVHWRGRWEHETGGVTMTLGVHLMDMLLWLMGDWGNVRALAAVRDRDIEVDNVSVACVQFENGALASIVNSAVSPGQQTYLRLDFQRATVELPHLYTYTNADWRISLPPNADDPALIAAWNAMPPNVPADQGAQLSTFLDYRLRGERPPMSGAEARRTLEFIASLYKAAFGGQTITRGSILPGDPFYSAMDGGMQRRAPQDMPVNS